VNEKNYGDQLREIFETKFELGFEPPVVFIDTHYNKSNPEELQAFERETEKLWRISLNRKPFECLTRFENIKVEMGLFFAGPKGLFLNKKP
jgi:hypothetical protein